MPEINTSKTLRPYPGAKLSVMLRQKISDVTITQNELPIESERDKQSIFDIACKSQPEGIDTVRSSSFESLC